MRAVGRLTSAVILAAVVLGAVLGVRSVPDLKRYLRIRNM